MEALEGIRRLDGQLSPPQDGKPLNPEKDEDSVFSSRENSKTQISFPSVLTFPLCQETVVRWKEIFIMPQWGIGALPHILC